MSRNATVYMVQTVSPTIDPESIAEQMATALSSVVPDGWNMGRPAIDVRVVPLIFEAFEGGAEIVVASGPYEGVVVSSTTADQPSGEPAGSTGIAALKAHVRSPSQISSEELAGFRDAVRGSFAGLGIASVRSRVLFGTESIPGDFGVPPTPPLPGAQTNFLVVAGIAAAGALFLSVVGARRRDRQDAEEPEPELSGHGCPPPTRAVGFNPRTGKKLDRPHCWDPRSGRLVPRQMRGLGGSDVRHLQSMQQLLRGGRKEAELAIRELRSPRRGRKSCQTIAQGLNDAENEIFAGLQLFDDLENPSASEAKRLEGALEKVFERIEGARKQFNERCFVRR